MRFLLVALLASLCYAQTDVLCPVCDACPEGMRPVDSADDSGCLSCECIGMDPTSDPTERRTSTDAVVKFTTTIFGIASARRNWDQTQAALAKSMSLHYGVDESMFRFTIRDSRRSLQASEDNLLVDVEIGPFNTMEEADEIARVVTNTPVAEVDTTFVEEMQKNEGGDGVSLIEISTAYSDTSDEYGMDPTADPTEYRPEDTTSAVALYYVGEKGTECDVSSLVLEDECAAAAANVGLSFIPSEPAEFWSGPYGCIAAENDGEIEVFFNSYQEGSPMAEVSPVCVISEAKEDEDPFVVVTGDGCVVVDDCVQSTNYPNSYGNNEECSVSVLRDAVVTTSGLFRIETCCDKLRINGVATESANAVPDTLDTGDEFTWFSDYSITLGGWQLCFSEPIDPNDIDTYVKFTLTVHGITGMDAESWDSVKNSLKKSISYVYGVVEDMVSVSLAANSRRNLQTAAYTLVNVEIGPYIPEDALYTTDVVNNTPLSVLDEAFQNDLEMSRMEGISLIDIGEAVDEEGCPMCVCEYEGDMLAGDCDYSVCQSCMAGTSHCTSCYPGRNLIFDDSEQKFTCDSPIPPTAAPTDIYNFVESDTKCPMDDEYRTFKLDFTSEENCARRCQEDSACEFFSTDPWFTRLCIGCTHLPSTLRQSFAPFWFTYSIGAAPVIPSQAPTPPPTYGYEFFGEDVKCASSDRTFKIDFFTVERCAIRCQEDAACTYVSEVAGSCIGCSVEPSDYHSGAMSYYVIPQRKCEHENIEAQVECLNVLLGHYERTCEV